MLRVTEDLLIDTTATPPCDSLLSFFSAQAQRFGSFNDEKATQSIEKHFHIVSWTLSRLVDDATSLRHCRHVQDPSSSGSSRHTRPICFIMVIVTRRPLGPLASFDFRGRTWTTMTMSPASLFLFLLFLFDRSIRMGWLHLFFQAPARGQARRRDGRFLQAIVVFFTLLFQVQRTAARRPPRHALVVEGPRHAFFAPILMLAQGSWIAANILPTYWT